MSWITFALFGGVFWVTLGRAKPYEYGVTFWGRPPGTRNCPGAALIKKAPRKRSPAREPETSHVHRFYGYSSTVWTSIWAWRGGAADPLPEPAESPT